MEAITIEEWVQASKSSHVKTPGLLRAILSDLEKAGFPPKMAVTPEMTQSPIDPGMFNAVFNDALCACS